MAAGRVAFLVTAETTDTADTATTELKKRLKESGLFVADTAAGSETGRWLFANRRELLCERDPDKFTEETAAAIRQKALARIYGVGLPVPGDLIAADPFLLTLRLADCLSPASIGQLSTGNFVLGRLTQSAFQLSTQEQVIETVRKWEERWVPEGVNLARSGAVFYAAHAAESAKREMTIIGGLGLIGVTVLFWIVFGRVANIIYVIGLIGLSTLSGFAATLLVFGHVHILVLVFAAMLVGVVADYAVHAMAAGASSNWQNPAVRRGHILRPMSVSMLTTAAGFSALAFLDVAMFRQFALFAVAGVITAWLLVLFVYVPLESAPRRPEVTYQRWLRLTSSVNRRMPGGILYMSICLLLAGLTVLGAMNADVLDDVRQFQPRDETLLEEEAQIEAITGGVASQTFLVSQGTSLNDAKRAEEAALQTLPEDAGVLAFSRMDPSNERRADNREVIATRLEAPYLNDLQARLGLSSRPQDSTPSDAQRPDWLNDLHVTGKDGMHFLIAQPIGVGGWKGPHNDDSRQVDVAAVYTQAFGSYRILAALSLLVAAVVSAIFILFVYRNWRALGIVAAPCAAMLGGIFIPAVFGLPVSFFAMAGAMVLFGVSIDYSAFMWEAGRKRENWTPTAVLVGAVTTLLSMGLLAMSETFPVRSFGVTVAAGVVCGLVYSMLPYRLAKCEGETHEHGL
ncbi:lipoprotein transmembrane [Henriciella sp.]|uniref:lipoprotein transmembrane n=1 Tax=Henriciella sp. TaxID=1968823 RepID=UPI002601F7A3|nr:lipoprotein transmembrane [Henriciella sp.]